jgi:alginate O-acetyltransferase complex protein AlgI
MIFNSLTFIVFFLVVLLLHYLPLSWRIKKINLLVASYVFYAAWNPPFVALLWLSTVVDWALATRIAKTESRVRKKLLLLVSLATNLGVLGYFKYGTFILENFVALLHAIGIIYQPAVLDIILPIGISFYTFQTLSYILDVYRGQTQPSKSFLDFALFVTFFPQLVAGPILRVVEFLPQCLKPRRATPREFAWGMSLLVAGLFQKVIMADALLAPIVDKVYSAPDKAGSVEVWTGTLAFSGQIFFDFSGYSTCAIGTALCLGFRLTENFHAPYAAIGFSDFWRRWHMSLSRWLRDYLYVPLGGNRQGTGRTYSNVMLTMLIGGLWHGASWNFVVWGGLHGIYLVVERLLRRLFVDGVVWNNRYVKIALALLTFLGVCLGWVFFRAHDLHTAITMISAMFSTQRGKMNMEDEVITVFIITLGLLIWHWQSRDSSAEKIVARLPWWLTSLLLAVCALAVILTPGDNRAFIYFQF